MGNKQPDHTPWSPKHCVLEEEVRISETMKISITEWTKKTGIRLRRTAHNSTHCANQAIEKAMRGEL